MDSGLRGELLGWDAGWRPSPLVVITGPVVPFVKGEIVNLGVLADFQSV